MFRKTLSGLVAASLTLLSLGVFAEDAVKPAPTAEAKAAAPIEAAAKKAKKTKNHKKVHAESEAAAK